ncbi:hypothetical protein [Saccharococcus sp. Marseille-Q5394]|nr:hypothetical protein [Saccharococcus sp. Marseille-Q5394]
MLYFPSSYLFLLNDLKLRAESGGCGEFSVGFAAVSGGSGKLSGGTGEVTGVIENT